MKHKKSIFTIIFVIAILFFLTNKVNAGDLQLNKLRYDVKLNLDGSADITETWNIYIEDTNTLFKTFKIDSSKYKEITNVKVKELNKANETEFIRINTEMYHVNKGCFYALVNAKGKYEIAWGVQERNKTKVYEISYKVIDAVKNYNDCSEFYWQFISADSEIPAKVVTGIITLPVEITNEEEFRVWAHGPLNGNIQKISNSRAEFNVTNLSAKTMVEARVIVPTEAFFYNANIQNIDRLEYVLNQEQKWADEANAKREKEARRQEQITRIIKITLILLNVAGIIVAIILITKIIKYNKELKANPKMKPEQKLDWYRDIPDETSTPAQAGLLYYFAQSGLQANISKIVSATILDLCMKKYIELEVIAGKKDEIKIILKQEMDKEKLPKDEKIVYELLQNVAKNENNSFTMKELKKYCENHASSVLSTFSKIEVLAKQEEEEKRNYEEKIIRVSTNYVVKSVGYFFLILFSIFFMYVAIIPSLIAMIYSCVLAGRYNRLTQKGTNEKEQWVALKKYMEEFSLIDEKTVPELVLWEKYLVYATAFGIADKVLKQLKVIYPQITDGEYMMSYGGTYMHLMYTTGIKNSLISSINTSVSSTYNSINYSSGSGSGGGFSGGGGFGGGGGRNGRKIMRYIYKALQSQRPRKINLIQ